MRKKKIISHKMLSPLVSIFICINCSKHRHHRCLHEFLSSKLGSDLASQLPLEVNQSALDSAHTKTNILLQAYFCRLPLPSSDYHTDTKSVLDQAIRVLQVKSDMQHLLQVKKLFILIAAYMLLYAYVGVCICACAWVLLLSKDSSALAIHSYQVMLCQVHIAKPHRHSIFSLSSQPFTIYGMFPQSFDSWSTLEQYKEITRSFPIARVYSLYGESKQRSHSTPLDVLSIW